ncbi:MAG TPA: hypothetical protein VMH61_09250 [Candidatus Acidoferrales bacterium]|nr:hypothetical protein [Candidatus Acidoferrales bacterium]
MRAGAPRPRARSAARDAIAALRRLEAIRFEFGGAIASERRGLLVRLARTTLNGAAQVLRLHEAMLFARAHPDDPACLRVVERALRAFERRRDVARFRASLAGSGVAGTDLPFRFFAPTALRLARAWPGRLAIDWDEWDDPARLEELLPLLAADAEMPGLDEWDLGLRGWLRRMTGGRIADGAFVARRLATRIADPFVFEKAFDGIDAPFVLCGGRGGPSRTLERWPGAPVAFQRGALRRARPDLRAELARPPLAVTPVSRRDGEQLVALARDAMVTRRRDLDVFAYASADDVRLVECGEGLQFACLGAIPDRRLLLESVYGFLTLRNGVPTGYVLTSALFGSAEIAYNVFETFRGGEAGAVYGRVLAMTAHLFGTDSFVVTPYQLGGAGNDEGLESGAWWFYRKFGFAPRARAARALMRREEARMRRNPAHRSSRATLARLAEENVYWHAGRARSDVLGLLPLPNVGLAAMDLLAKRFGADDARGAGACELEAVRRLGHGPERAWSRDERRAFTRWAPLVLALPGLERWPARERRALLAVIRAKGGVRESEFVRRFDAHVRLRAAVAHLARSTRVG